MAHKKNKTPNGLIWANVVVPDPIKGGKARRNLAFLCESAKVVKDSSGGIVCVRIAGGIHDGYETFPAYGVGLRLRAPKGRKDAQVEFQGRIC